MDGQFDLNQLPRMNQNIVGRKALHFSSRKMSVLRATLGLAVLLAFAIAFAPRARISASQQEVTGRPVSGFLGDYSALAPDAKNGDLLLYVKDRSALKNYRKFMIDPINVYLLPEAQARAIDADDLERLTQYFRQAVIDELQKSGQYEIVNEPGPGVLELNVAITNVEPTGGKRNAVVTGATTAASVATVPGISLATPRISVGRISIEGEMLDSQSGERLVAFMTSKSGRRWFSGLRQFKKWGDIEAAFRSWAKDFRQRVDEVHAQS
jgi:Protein of unknown function (DUF3313)